MSKTTTLASGSQANCALYHGSDDTRILIDAGLSCKQIASRLGAIGVMPNQLDAIIVTHEHADHTAGLDVWFKTFRTPIFANRKTMSAILGNSTHLRANSFVEFQHRQYFAIRGITIDAFHIKHDAADPSGFVLYDGDSVTGYVTDTGDLGSYGRERLEDVDEMFLESNYDLELVKINEERPNSVHKRVVSRTGHLSNEDCALTLKALPRLKKATLCHLSRSCNSPELARAASELALTGRNVEIRVATP